MANTNVNLNQDAVEQCKTKMREAIVEGDAAKLKKFMDKAKRLGAEQGDLDRILKSGAARRPRRSSCCSGRGDY